MESEKLQLFEDQRIRTAWDEENEEWYFSIVDVVGALTESSDFDTSRKYWNKTKQRMVEEGNELFVKIGESYGVSLEEWNHDIDHVHIMFRGKPQTELTKFINAYKSASSRLIKKEHPEIKDKLWKEAFWSQSYCLLTTGGVTIDVIRSYIETQGEEDGRRRENRLKKYCEKIQDLS